MSAESDKRETITAVILAGGSGRRMGGRDKGLLPLRGRTLIEHVLERLSPQCDKIVININRHRDVYAKYGYPLIDDSLPGGLGPLAGLLSAMEYSQSDYVLSVPCDTPQLPRNLVARMLESMERHQADVCTVDDGERLHPVIMLVRHSLTASLRNYLESGHRKVHDWYYSNKHCAVDFSDQPKAFMNINTPEQLREQEKG